VRYFHLKIVDVFKTLIVGKCKEASDLLLNAIHFAFLVAFVERKLIIFVIYLQCCLHVRLCSVQC
jgi:hypothetical protein